MRCDCPLQTAQGHPLLRAALVFSPLMGVLCEMVKNNLAQRLVPEAASGDRISG